jgi:hypothetical protein
VNAVAEVHELHDRLDFVVPVWPAAHDLQEEVDLGRGKDLEFVHGVNPWSLRVVWPMPSSLAASRRPPPTHPLSAGTTLRRRRTGRRKESGGVGNAEGPGERVIINCAGRS